MNKKTHDRNIEMLGDVVSNEYASSCCEAKVYNPTNEWFICMNCKEYCDVVKE